jgi:hypothetical protein
MFRPKKFGNTRKKNVKTVKEQGKNGIPECEIGPNQYGLFSQIYINRNLSNRYLKEFSSCLI